MHGFVIWMEATRRCGFRETAGSMSRQEGSDGRGMECESCDLYMCFRGGVPGTDDRRQSNPGRCARNTGRSYRIVDYLLLAGLI